MTDAPMPSDKEFEDFWQSHAFCDAVTRATLAFLGGELDYDQLLFLVRDIYARCGVKPPASVVPPKPRPNLRIVQ